MSHLQCFHCHLLTSSFSNLANMRRAADRLEFSQVFIDKLTTHFVLPAIGDYILLVAHIWAFRTSTPTPNEAKTAMSFAQPWVTKHWGKRIRTLHNDNWPQTGLRKVTQWLAMSMWGPLSGCAKRGCPKRGEVVAANAQQGRDWFRIDFATWGMGRDWSWWKIRALDILGTPSCQFFSVSWS